MPCQSRIRTSQVLLCQKKICPKIPFWPYLKQTTDKQTYMRVDRKVALPIKLRTLFNIIKQIFITKLMKKNITFHEIVIVFLQYFPLKWAIFAQAALQGALFRTLPRGGW